MSGKSNRIIPVKSLVAIFILIISGVFLSQQIPLIHSSISQIDFEGSKPQDSFISSYVTHSPITITSNENFTSLGFPGSGTLGDPYEIENYNITAVGYCISIHNTDAFFSIHDCLLTGEIPDNGIELVNVSNGEITKNILTGNECGVSLYESHNNTIIDNILSHNDVGLITQYSSYNLILANTVTHNYDGMWFDILSNNTVTGNVIFRNAHYGLCIRLTSNNTITYNSITGNEIGLMLFSNTGNNSIHHNFIANNKAYSAYDDSTDNHWNITGIGNFWSDYNGTGVYHVPGSGGAIDYFPGIAESTLTIDSPANLEYIMGTTGNNITWTPSSEHPSYYVIYRNGTEIKSTSWNGSKIIVNIDGLNIGSYNYTIVVNDTMSFIVIDTVFVVVLPVTSSTTTNGMYYIFIIILLSIPVIGALVVVVTHVRHRK